MLLAATSVPSFLQAGEKQPTLSIKNQKIAIDSQWDVIVVGGGPAGCTAATVKEPKPCSSKRQANWAAWVLPE